MLGGAKPPDPAGLQRNRDGEVEQQAHCADMPESTARGRARGLVGEEAYPLVMGPVCAVEGAAGSTCADGEISPYGVREIVVQQDEMVASQPVLVLRRAMERAMQSGIAGAEAMTVDIFLLMWLRTTMNYQYRHGTTTRATLAELWRQGGVRRFYRGVGFALFEGPFSRFTSTATNMASFEILNNFEGTKDMSIATKTAFASTASGILRLAYFPIDTCKCILQVEGKDGLRILAQKVRLSGASVLWHGGLSAAGNTTLRHFLWFVTYNYLNALTPHREGSFWETHARHASIGLACALVSDCLTNPFAIMKTYRQTSSVPVSYSQAFVQITQSNGFWALFYRGLGTRIWVDAINSVVFTVLWKFFLQDSREQAKEPANPPPAGRHTHR
jgi:hypothetical protein